MTSTPVARRYGRRYGPLPALLLFVVMSLLVLVPVAAMAPPGDRATTNNALNAQATGEATADQPATQPTIVDGGGEQVNEQTEPPTATVASTGNAAEEEAQPSIEATDETLTRQSTLQTFTLSISVFRCDHPTFDPYFSSNAQMVFDQCVGPGSGAFDIISNIPVDPQSGSSLEFQIGADLAIQEQVSPGYGNPIANCVILDANGNVIDQIGPGEVNGGFWKVGGVGGDVHCDWYQVDQGIGVVYIVNMACPNSTAFPKPDLNQLIATCNSPAGSITFGVQYGQVYGTTDATGGEFNDVFFDGVYTGPIAVWAEPPPKYESARMFCQVNTIDGVEIAPFAEVPVSAFRATGLTLGHDQRLHCSWFNIPEGPGVLDPGPPPTQTPGIFDPGGPLRPTLVPGILDPGSAPVASPPATLSEFRVRLHTCPAGYDPLAPGVNPELDCQAGPNGVTFALADMDADTPDMQSMTGDSLDNSVTFGGLAPGEYTITEAAPQGVATMFVLGCAGGGIDPTPFIVDGALSINVPPGVIQTCPWFNVPSLNVAQNAAEGTPEVATGLTGSASLTMYVYDCPAGLDISSSDANPQASCTPATGVNLYMDDTIDDNGGWDFETGIDGSSTVDGLAADTYTINAQVRNGTTATFVWDCYDLTGSSLRTDPLATGSKLIYDLADGAQIRCDWLNITGGTGRVIIHSHACANEVPAYTLGLAQLDAQCAADPGTIDYTVVSYRHQETQPASKHPLVLASFANVPTGYVAVVEDLEAEGTDPVVYCQVNLEDGSSLSPPSEMGGNRFDRSIHFLLEPGQVVFCDWFNVARGNTQVQVTNHACPAGFDAYSADTAALIATCTDDPGSIDVTVEDGSLFTETKPATSSTVLFYPVPSGQVRISEKLPPTYGLPVVICKVDFETTMGVMPPTKMTVVTRNPSIVAGLTPGQQLLCDWYNVPGGLGSVSMWKQSCPAGFDASAASRLELENRCGEDIETVEFTLTNGSFSATASSTNLFPYSDFHAVPTGTVTVTESLPHGYGTPVVYCRVQQTGQQVTTPERVDISGGNAISWQLEPDQWLICEWYNVPETDSTVTVVKWICPKDTPSDRDHDYYAASCTEVHRAVDFWLTHSVGAAHGETDGNGQIQWPGVPPGAFSIQETIPRDYIEPVVFCSASSDVSLAVFARMESGGGYVEGELTEARTNYICHWFNIFGGPGEITVTKFTCLPGYDLHAAGADPKSDCVTTTNGVAFTLTDDGAATVDLQSMTGDSIDGAVVFGGLAPGDYTVTETVPPGTASVFVLDCTGGKMGAIRPYPLSTGETLTVAVGAGEKIGCTWFNVPEFERGRLTVHKYVCVTESFVSGLDCETFEGGQSFDLVMWNGETWEHQASGVTDAAGQYAWVDLPSGQYWLDEPDREWCRIASNRISDNGDWLDVLDGQDTVVAVYNCGIGQPGTPGETPGKYPNTGVGPIDQGRDDPTTLPAIAQLAGMLAVFCRRRHRQSEHAGYARTEAAGAPTVEIFPAWSRRRFAAALGFPLAGSLVLGRAILAQGDPESARIEGTPASLCLSATPGAAPPPDAGTCVRGAVPVTIRIETIGVDAPVEILETVGGVMQQPSDDRHVAWYKESARLGENGNILMAGHLNWWGVPEAVFFNLGTLRDGDHVVLVDEQGREFTYTIEWVRQESSLQPPDDEVLGMTSDQAVTLITCGGEWDSATSEYTQRTVARAARNGTDATPVA